MKTAIVQFFMALSILSDLGVGLYALLHSVWWLLALSCVAASWLALHLWALHERA